MVGLADKVVAEAAVLTIFPFNLMVSAALLEATPVIFTEPPNGIDRGSA